jgi:hypothetical protein
MAGRPGGLKQSRQMHSIIFFYCGNHDTRTYELLSGARTPMTPQKLAIYHPALRGEEKVGLFGSRHRRHFWK